MSNHITDDAIVKAMAAKITAAMAAMATTAAIAAMANILLLTCFLKQIYELLLYSLARRSERCSGQSCMIDFL
jgi:inner membrane protein involved in colicin E2 resistance